MKRPGIRFTRRKLLVGIVALVVASGLAYLLIPELLVWSGTLLIAEVEPFPADAIVILGGGGPDRAREAADLFNDGFAPRVVVTTEEASDNYRELAELGIELTLPHENYLRVLLGFGVPDENIVRIEDASSESMDELLGVRQFAIDRAWRRLIVVTSNYHSRRALLISDYVFDLEWKIAVIGSRYSEFRPNGWWREVRHVRTFLIEFQKLIAYELYLRPECCSKRPKFLFTNLARQYNCRSRHVWGTLLPRSGHVRTALQSNHRGLGDYRHRAIPQT